MLKLGLVRKPRAFRNMVIASVNRESRRSLNYLNFVRRLTASIDFFARWHCVAA